jgi:hypothetical protein
MASFLAGSGVGALNYGAIAPFPDEVFSVLILAG